MSRIVGTVCFEEIDGMPFVAPLFQLFVDYG
jgi:hypothetical protein